MQLVQPVVALTSCIAAPHSRMPWAFRDIRLTAGFVACMQPFSDVYPHLRTATDVPTLVKIADVNWDEVDAAFCCLPHATTQETLAQLPKHIKIVDLSADFRLRNVDTYAEWCVTYTLQALHGVSFCLVKEQHCSCQKCCRI